MEKIAVFIPIPEAQVGLLEGCIAWIKPDPDTGGYKATVDKFPKIFARGETQSETEQKIVTAVKEAYNVMGESEREQLRSNFVDMSSDSVNRVGWNCLFQRELREAKFDFLAHYLRHEPNLIDKSTFNMLADFLVAHAKGKSGISSKYTKTQIWEMCVDYGNYIDNKVHDRCKLAKICKKHNVTESNLKKLYSRLNTRLKAKRDMNTDDADLEQMYESFLKELKDN